MLKKLSKPILSGLVFGTVITALIYGMGIDWLNASCLGVFYTAFGIVAYHTHTLEQKRKQTSGGRMTWGLLLAANFASMFGVEGLMSHSPQRHGMKLWIWGVAGISYLLGRMSNFPAVATTAPTPDSAPAPGVTKSSG